MSTSDRAATIDRSTAAAARLALKLMLAEWRLPFPAWEEIGELLDLLSRAVAEGDATAVDKLTFELQELSGSRVGRIGNPQDGTPPEDAGRTPLPEPYRERVVALVHALDQDSPSGVSRPAPTERA
ncbi:CATRA system-associated protein [Streptomyces sp. NPDC051287]|uniref:CATRA system-associated protein n=1 Tax=Streptomyces sp. NPDC051287 TaxID=3365648 RepID=UPI0037A8EA60